MKQTDLTMLDELQKSRRQDMMRWLLTHGREWVGYADLEEFPFRLTYADEGLLDRDVRTRVNATGVHYRITDKGVALIGETHDAV